MNCSEDERKGGPFECFQDDWVYADIIVFYEVFHEFAIVEGEPKHSSDDIEDEHEEEAYHENIGYFMDDGLAEKIETLSKEIKRKYFYISFIDDE